VSASGWFADAGDDDSRARYPWQPFLQLEAMCLPFPMWFSSEQDCEEFIRTHIIGQPMLDYPDDKEGSADGAEAGRA
jgi:hypothetical protein